MLFSLLKDEPIYIDKETSAKEVFGPKATIPGHPIQAKRVTTSSGEFRAHEPRNPVISHVTLLYRRFQAEELSTFEQEKNGLHSVQWIPTFAKGNFVFVSMKIQYQVLTVHSLDARTAL